MKASRVFFLVFLIILPLCMVNSQPVRATENSWTTKKPMPTARSRLGVAVVNGKIYAIGGYNGSHLNTNEMYDPATDTWTTKKLMPTPRCDFGIAVYQNKIYVIGGFVGPDEPTGANEVYDPLTDMWETEISMPTPRAQLDANVVNGRIYLIGGRTANPYSALSLNEVYDPLTGSWTTKAQISNAVMDYASAVANNKIYIISGFNFTSLISLTQIYDPLTDTWSFGNSIPTAMMGAAAAATTGMEATKRIYIIGGGSIIASSGNQIYDPEKDVWNSGASMLTRRRDLGVAVVDDILYAIGGDSGWTLQFYGTNEQYTPFGYGTVPSDTTPPAIYIVSPENKTYTVNNVSLTFTLNEPASWIGYSLNGQDNVTIPGNITLTGLLDGLHSLRVYANDTAGNMGSSETVHFTISTEASHETQPAEPFSITWIAAAAVAIIVIIPVAAVILKKRRK